MNESTPTDQSRLAFWLGVVPSRALGVISCLMLFVMMVLTFVDVAGRYLFSSPLPAGYEVISLIMPAIIFCALPHVCQQENHVTIDLLDSFVTEALRRWQGVFVSLVSAGAMMFIAWRLFERYRDHLRFNQVTDELYLPLWPFSLAMAVLCGIAVLPLIANAFLHFSGRKG